MALNYFDLFRGQRLALRDPGTPSIGVRTPNHLAGVTRAGSDQILPCILVTTIDEQVQEQPERFSRYSVRRTCPFLVGDVGGQHFHFEKEVQRVRQGVVWALPDLFAVMALGPLFVMC